MRAQASPACWSRWEDSRGSALSDITHGYDGLYPNGTVSLDGTPGTYVFLHVEGHGGYWFDYRLRHHPGYVAEKLNWHNPVDSATLADFLDRLGVALVGDAHETIAGAYKTTVTQHGAGVSELKREAS